MRFHSFAVNLEAVTETSYQNKLVYQQWASYSILATTITTLWGIKTHRFFGHNLKKGYPIVIIFGTYISDTTGHQMTVQFPTSPNVCFCTIWENRTDKMCIKINKKLFKNFIFPDMWPPTVNQL